MADDIGSAHLPTTFTTFENQRWYPLKGWSAHLLPTDRPAWSDEDGKQALPKDGYPLPPQHAWVGEWAVTVDAGGTTDDEGWQYARDFPFSWFPVSGKSKVVRRRQWRRGAIHRPVAKESFDDSDYVRVQGDADTRPPGVDVDGSVHRTTMAELMAVSTADATPAVASAVPEACGPAPPAAREESEALPVIEQPPDRDEAKFNSLLHKFAESDDATGAVDSSADDS